MAGRKRCLTYNAILQAMREAKNAGYWRVSSEQLVAYLPDNYAVSARTVRRYCGHMVEAGLIIKHGERLGYSLLSSGSIPSRIIDHAQAQRGVYAMQAAQRFNLSRTTIKQYLDGLEAAGLLIEYNGHYQLA